MTRSAFYDARLAHWKAANDPRVPDPDFQALRDVEAAQAAGVTWDPEKPPVWMPQRAKVQEYGGGTVFAAVVPDDREDNGALPMLATIMESWANKPERLPFLRAMVAAYNRERDGEVVPIERFRAVHEAMQVETNARERDVQEERARCAGIMKWLQDVLSEEFCGEPIAEALRRIENGLPNPEPPGRKHWLGPDGQNCALCGKPWPHEHTPEQLAAWEAKGGARGKMPEPAREWPDQESCCPEYILHGEREPWRLDYLLLPVLDKAGYISTTRYVLVAQRIVGPSWRHLTEGEAQEAARRWEEEPRLRKRIERAMNHMRAQRGRVGETIDGLLNQVGRILTGKEY